MLNITTNQVTRPHAVLCNGGVKINTYLPDFSSIHVLIPIEEEEFNHLMSKSFRANYPNNRKGPIGEILILGESNTGTHFSISNVIFPINLNSPRTMYQEFCTFDRSEYQKAIVVMNEDSLSAFSDVIKYLKEPKYVIVVKLDINLNYDALQSNTSFVSL